MSYWLTQVGLALVKDHSGKLFTKNNPTLKDIAANQDVD